MMLNMSLSHSTKRLHAILIWNNFFGVCKPCVCRSVPLTHVSENQWVDCNAIKYREKKVKRSRLDLLAKPFLAVDNVLLKH